MTTIECIILLNDLISCCESDDYCQSLKEKLIKDVIEKHIFDNSMFGEQAYTFYDAIKAKYTLLRLEDTNDQQANLYLKRAFHYFNKFYAFDNTDQYKGKLESNILAFI